MPKLAKKHVSKSKKVSDLLPEVAARTSAIESLLNTTDENGKRVGNYQCGVYAFFDYYGEPIYVGQTKERLRTRVRRHLTNQRTDAVAMSVLDPLEVVDIELWPIDATGLEPAEICSLLNSAEYTVYKRVFDASQLKAVLNEKPIQPTKQSKLPQSFKKRIVPQDIFNEQKHDDLRIARRATVIAELARVVTERKVSKGLRRTLWLQARRLEWLAKNRVEQFRDEPEEPSED